MFKANGKRDYNIYIYTCQFSFYLSITVLYFNKRIITFTLFSSIRIIVFRPFFSVHSLFLVILNLSPVRFAVCRKRDSKPLY